MEIIFTRQFEKEIGKITDKKLARNIENTIFAVQRASVLSDIVGLKKLHGHSNAYRIRLGNYRIGLYVDHNVVEFSCFMNRNEIYKYFP